MEISLFLNKCLSNTRHALSDTIAAMRISSAYIALSMTSLCDTKWEDWAFHQILMAISTSMMQSEGYKYTILTDIEWTTMLGPLLKPILLASTASSSEAESWWRNESQRFIQWYKLHKHRVPRKCKYGPEVPKKSRHSQDWIKIRFTLLIRREAATSLPDWHEGHNHPGFKCIITQKK